MANLLGSNGILPCHYDCTMLYIPITSRSDPVDVGFFPPSRCDILGEDRSVARVDEFLTWELGVGQGLKSYCTEIRVWKGVTR